MSKKKNTLKDLDDFLKQQAASLVPPSPVNVPPSPKIENIIEPKTTQEESAIKKAQPLTPPNATESRESFYETILRTVESYPNQTAEDKMLINTVLYLKSGERWKEVIREYWRTHT